MMVVYYENHRTLMHTGVGIAPRCGLGGPGIESQWWARFSTPVQTGSEDHPASCTIGTGSFPGVKRPGRGVDHPPTSTTEVKERVDLYLYLRSGPSWPVLGGTLPVNTLCSQITEFSTLYLVAQIVITVLVKVKANCNYITSYWFLKFHLLFIYRLRSFSANLINEHGLMTYAFIRIFN
jgi:hypothetical protein